MKDDIKIGFYCSSLSWGGLEMNMLRHAKWMQELGWNVVLFCVENSSIHQESGGLEVFTISRNKKYFDYKNATILSRLFKELNINLIWIRDSRDMSTIGIAKSKSGGRFKILYQQAMQLGVDKKDFIHTRRFSKIDLWISPLPFLAEQVIVRTNFPNDRIKVIPLGIDTEVFNNIGVSKEEARQSLGIPASKIILGILGRIDPKKGQLFLLKSLLKLRKSGLDIDVLLVGDKTQGEALEYYHEMECYISENELGDNVHIRPFMKDVSSFYNSIDCFVMASEAETFGMVTLEAMLFGLPVIGTNTSGTPEILGNGEFGSLFTPNDIDDFCNKLTQLLKEKGLLTDLGNKAKLSILQRFEHRQIIQKIGDEIFSMFQ